MEIFRRGSFSVNFKIFVCKLFLRIIIEEFFVFLFVIKIIILYYKYCYVLLVIGFKNIIGIIMFIIFLSGICIFYLVVWFFVILWEVGNFKY